MNLAAILKSLTISIIDLFRPKMLLMIFLIPILIFLAWVFVTWLFWGQLLGLTEGWVQTTSWVLSFSHWLSQTWGFGVSTLTFLLTLFWVVLVLFPLIFISILILISLLTMPVVINYRERDFPGLEKKKGFSLAHQLWQAVLSGCVFVILWSLILPLWLIPPLGPTLSFIVTSWFQKKILILDCLAEYASKEEYKKLTEENRSSLWILSFTMTVLLTIPVLNLIIPIYSALVFSHFLFGRLKEQREKGLAPLS